MSNKYNLEDIPMILSSISWQLKRIADALEPNDHIDEQEKEIPPRNNNEPKIRRMIANLNREE